MKKLLFISLLFLISSCYAQVNTRDVYLNADGTLRSYWRIGKNAGQINWDAAKGKYRVITPTDTFYLSSEGYVNSITDSIGGRLTTAESSITTLALKSDTLDAGLVSLSAIVTLKADIETVNTVSGVANNAAAGVAANATAITNLDGDITSLESALFLYAKRDSVISYINIAPAGIKISADKLDITTLTGVIFNSSASGQRIVLDPSSNAINIYDGSGLVGSIYGNGGKILVSGTLGAGEIRGTSYWNSGYEVMNSSRQMTNIASLTVTGDILTSSGSVIIGSSYAATQSWVTSQGFATQSWVNSSSTPAWANISGKPSTFTPSSHAHSTTDITGLQTYVDDRIDNRLSFNAQEIYYKDWSGANQSMTVITW